MEGLIVIAVIWFVISTFAKAAKQANKSGSGNRRAGSPYSTPPASPPTPRTVTRPPLAPVARPGSTGAPDWSEIMTMLSGTQPQKAAPQAQDQDMEGVSTESTGPSGSLSGSSMMEGSKFIMDGSQPMMDESGPDYEGQTLPGELSADAVAMLPSAPESIAPPMRSAFLTKRFDPAAMRDAVIWSEILAKPKSLRRVAR